MTPQAPWTDDHVHTMAQRLFMFAQSYAGDELPEREPAMHRWLDRECSREHPDGYQASNHFRTYQALQELYNAPYR